MGKTRPNAFSAVKVIFFTLFCILAMSLVPLALSYFVSAQIKIGNGDAFLIRWLQAHERGVVFGFWIFCVIGLGIALPDARKSGFFR